MTANELMLSGPPELRVALRKPKQSARQPRKVNRDVQMLVARGASLLPTNGLHLPKQTHGHPATETTP
jgi:hypothetical protein